MDGQKEKEQQPVTGAVRAAVRRTLALLRSMRFAIGLLLVICVAAVTGTVLQQGRAFVFYAETFGLFWAGFFRWMGLTDVYGSWWFVLMLAFLALSTALCLVEHTPVFLRQMRHFREHITVRSLRAMRYTVQLPQPDNTDTALHLYADRLAATGWRLKLQRREGSGTMLAARRGGANRLGYVATHGAIVLVCLGGLLDGSLPVAVQMWLENKTAFQGSGLIADIAPEHRLDTGTLSFRGSMRVSEGGESDTAVLNRAEGVLIQELPFTVRLKKFDVAYYSTGMPRLFASDIEVQDKATGERLSARVEVNRPFVYRGVRLYQSDFGDGGSSVQLAVLPVSRGIDNAPGSASEPAAAAVAQEVTAGVGAALPFAVDGVRKTLETAELRVMNVSDFAALEQQDSTAGAGGRLADRLSAGLDRVQRVRGEKTLRNVGPSVVYKVRDDAGQAREYHNYMLPVALDANAPPVFLFGVRDAGQATYRYLRVAADDEGSWKGFFRLRNALTDGALRAQAAQRFAQQVSGQPELVQRNMERIGTKVLEVFAGVGTLVGSDGRAVSGLQAVAAYVQANASGAQAQQDSQLFVRILNGCMWQLMQISRERDGKAALAYSAYNRAWQWQNVMTLSEMALYPEPVIFALQDFDQVQASVFQVSKAPAGWLVYAGCALLTLGVFAMLFVRERRLWLWLPDAPAEEVVLAMSANRHTLDEKAVFAQLAEHLQAMLEALQQHAPDSGTAAECGETECSRKEAGSEGSEGS